MPVHKTKGSNASPLLNLGLGTLVPDWDSGEYSIDDQAFLESIDAKLSTDFCFRVYQVEPEINNVRVVKCYHKLVVVKETESQCSGCYVVFFIPTNDFSRSHHYDVSEEFLNSGALGSYSGLKIWTTLNGDVVRVNKYENGEKVFGVNLLESSDVPEFLAKVRAIQELCVNLTFQRGEKLTKNHDSQSGGEVSGGYNYYNSDFLPSNLIGDSTQIIYCNGVPYFDFNGDGFPDCPISLDMFDTYYKPDMDPVICIDSKKEEDDTSAPDPDPDSDSDPNMENWNNTNRGSENNYYGNGSDGSNDGSSGSQPDRDWIDPSKYNYLGIDNGNCFDGSVYLLEQTGTTLNGIKHSLFKADLTTQQLCRQSGELTETFVSYVKAQIQQRHFVIVGLDYKPYYYGNFDKTTDHHVVINGYYYENGVLHLNYIETGRYASHYADAYRGPYNNDYVFVYDKDKDQFIAVHWKYLENGNYDKDYPNYIIVHYRENQ